MKKITVLSLSILILFSLLLVGCGARIEFGSGAVSSKAEEAAVVITADEIPLLDGFTQLQKIDFSGSDCYEEIMLWQESHPDVDVNYTVALTDNLSVSSTAEGLEIQAGEFNADNLDAAAEKLVYLPELKNISFAFSDEDEILNIISSFAKVRPELSFDYDIKISGKVLDMTAAKLKLPSLTDKDAKKLSLVLPAMSNLKSVNLGVQADNPKLSFSGIAAMVEARPDVNYDYTFSVEDREFSLMDKTLDLNHIKFDDEGALVREIIPCMPKLEFLDMDFCHVSDEAMASIRDDFPDIKVVWRIWFGRNYSVRTDVETILASKPDAGGILPPGTVDSLKYCTDVKYLDLGHNPDMSDISFLEYMPKLEVLLICMDFWDDCSVLEHCPNIEYLEIQTTHCSDITPLKHLKKLKHLNICYLHDLDDISPLYDIDLERLWIGRLTPIPQEQIDKMQELHPDCEINTTTLDPTEGGWRYLDREKYGLSKLAPRYEELRKTFNYDIGYYAFSLAANDPLYNPHD